MWDFTIDCICIISEVVDDVWEYLVCNKDTSEILELNILALKHC